MSDCYDVYFGIGYKVSATSLISDIDLEYGLAEYIESKLIELDSDIAFYIETGAYYNGNSNDGYLILRDPFENGLDLEPKKKKLDRLVQQLNLSPVGEFGVVGGLLIT